MVVFDCEKLWISAAPGMWVEGETLDQFIIAQRDKPQVLLKLAGLWMRLAERLHEIGVAHADLHLRESARRHEDERWQCFLHENELPFVDEP